MTKTLVLNGLTRSLQISVLAIASLWKATPVITSTTIVLYLVSSKSTIFMNIQTLRGKIL